jgi:hypothetical protein
VDRIVVGRFGGLSLAQVGHSDTRPASRAFSLLAGRTFRCGEPLPAGIAMDNERHVTSLAGLLFMVAAAYSPAAS